MLTLRRAVFSRRNILFPTFLRPISSPAAPPPPPSKDESSLAILRSVLAAGKAAKEAKRKEADPVAAAGRLDGASVGRLFRLLRPEAPRLVGAIATLGVTTGISLLFPWAIGRVLDVALAPSAALSPGVISAGLLGLFCVQSSLIVLRSTLLTVAGERLSAGIRRDLLKAVLSQDAAWFDRQRTGDVINRLSSDTAALQNALTTQVTGGLRSLFMAAGSAGMLFYLSPPLAALSLVLIPPVAGMGMFYGRYVAGQQRAVQEALGQTMEVAEELVSNIRAVRQFGGERGAAARFDGAVGDSYRLARRIGIVAAWFDGAVHMAANFGLVAVLWYGGNQISSGALSAGDLTSFLMYSLYTGFNLGNLSKVYSDLKRASGVADRIYEIADTRPGIPLAAARPIEFWGGGGAGVDGAGERPTDIMRALDAAAGAAAAATEASAPLLAPAAVRGHVVFRSLHFAYPARPDAPVLAGLDLEVPPGTNLALVGASGSGKSTLALLLTRLYDATGGAVELDGVDVRVRGAGARATHTRHNAAHPRARANALTPSPPPSRSTPRHHPPSSSGLTLFGCARRWRWCRKTPRCLQCPWRKTSAMGGRAPRGRKWKTPRASPMRMNSSARFQMATKRAWGSAARS
jgi:ABC-type multidrug transport system fused ATPase/permease subunit